MIDVLLSEPVQALVLINILLTVSLLFPFVAGVWSLGLPGFMALGAYTASFMSMEMGLPIFPALLVGAAAAGVLAVPFALLALRVRGIYLSIATLAAAELVVLFFSHYHYFGGVSGYLGMAFFPVGPMAAIVFAVLAFCFWLYQSRLGKALIAAGSDPLVASCNGLHVAKLQIFALVFGACLAGLAGGLYAHYYSFISPLTFSFNRTVSILMFLVIGGLSPLGAVLGAVFLTLIPQYVTALEAWAPAVYAVIVILVVALMPDGFFPKNRLRAMLIRGFQPPGDAAAGGRT